jgi:hypothetical protein
MLRASLLMATLEYGLGQCLDEGTLRIASYNIRIADIKVLRSPTWKRAEIEATITIIIRLSLLKIIYIYYYSLFQFYYTNIKITLRPSPTNVISLRP